MLAGLATLSLVAGTAAPALADPGKVARLRADAAKVRHTIDAMNDQVEVLVERYNAGREELARIQAEQRETAAKIDRAERELAASKRQLDKRVWAIYTNGTSVSPLAELLGATSMHEALTTAKYSQGVVQADNRVIASVERARLALEALADRLAAQREARERLQRDLERQRERIESRLSAQRAYLARLDKALRRAVEEERQRQERIRRAEAARRLAAARREAAARAARAEASRRLARGTSRVCAAHACAARTRGAPRAGFSARAHGAARAAVAFALGQLGKPYEWGATGPSTYDCSGLTQTAYRYAGVAIPRVSADQYRAGGPHVSMAELRQGDLVFFASDLGDPSTVHHVGMYIGRGLMVEAPFTGANVRISSIGRSDYIGAVRPAG